jgi:two-component system phosphate regulon sensor histidine kinase PhoR
VTSIKGFVETLSEGAIDDPANARRFLEIIGKQVDRLAELIDDLLALSKIEKEGERGEIALEALPLCEAIASAVRLSEPKAEAKGITLDVACDATLMARMNAILIEQAVVNLIDNAIKYSEQGSTVAVSAARGSEETTISVVDRGTGIPKEHLPRLFERFYRVDKARSRALGGTGLGLSIVKHIALAHGGSVTVESAVGKGSTFTIHLPNA